MSKIHPLGNVSPQTFVLGVNPKKHPKMVKIVENPIKIDDLGVPLFLETPFCFRTIIRTISHQ